MTKTGFASLAVATLIIGASLARPASAAVQCWSGPLGILQHCLYVGPDYFGPGYYPYYPPPRPYYDPYWP
jgi:hypothetical protein